MKRKHRMEDRRNEEQDTQPLPTGTTACSRSCSDSTQYHVSYNMYRITDWFYNERVILDLNDEERLSALAKAQQLLLDQQERDYLLNQGKYEQEYKQSEEYQQQLKLKVREILTDREWRRKKMQMRISEEEGRLKKDEEETKEKWKRKCEHEEQCEGTGENKVKKGELRSLKLKTEDPNKSYVQRPVKRP